MDLSDKTYWLVGASDGIGAALARALDRAGADLILSARREDKLAGIAASLSRPARILACDVTCQDQVRAAAKAAGEIDGVIYMAGAYTPMAAPDWQAEAVETMVDVNFLGGLRVIGATLPEMLHRDRGHIVIIGSLAGFWGLPGAIGYGASKAAIMHLAQNLHADLKGTGVKVQMINPGFVKTRLTKKNTFRMPFITTPDKAAAQIVKAMASRRFSRSFPRLFAMAFKLRAALAVLRA
jgi:short-subunit dehydrogenase